MDSEYDSLLSSLQSNGIPFMMLILGTICVFRLHWEEKNVHRENEMADCTALLFFFSSIGLEVEERLKPLLSNKM